MVGISGENGRIVMGAHKIMKPLLKPSMCYTQFFVGFCCVVTWNNAMLHVNHALQPISLKFRAKIIFYIYGYKYTYL